MRQKRRSAAIATSATRATSARSTARAPAPRGAVAPAGTPGGDVQPHVVEHQVRVAEGGGDIVDVTLRELVRKLLEPRCQADGAQELARIVGPHRAQLEPGLDVAEAGGLERGARVVGPGEVPRAGDRLGCARVRL